MRNNSIFQYSCSLRARKLDWVEAKKLVLDVAQKCTPPFDEAEALNCLQSAWKYSPAYSLTDLGNAQRFVFHFEEDILFVYAFNKWLVWDTNKWNLDEDGRIFIFAKQICEFIKAESQNNSDAKIQKALIKHAKNSESLRAIKALLELAKTEESIPISHEILDKNPWLINCKNGVIDLHTGEIRSPTKSDLITKSLLVTYDKDATYPTWKKFLFEITQGDKDLVNFLKRAIGYTLTGLTTEHCIFFMYGIGRNGKSTFIEVLLHLFGDYQKKAPAEMLMSKPFQSIPNDIARLTRCRLAVSSELEQDRKFNESLIKDLTGGDKITARFMRGEWFDFEPTHKLWIYGNHKPTIKGTDEGIWARIKLIPFKAYFSEKQQDKNLLNKLLQELPGILNWAIEGCQDWQKQGLGFPQAVIDATDGYRTEMDHIASFINERCITGERNEKTKSSELFLAYQAWCDFNDEDSESHRMFGLKLSEKGYEKKKSGNGTFYFGIRLKSINYDF